MVFFVYRSIQSAEDLLLMMILMSIQSILGEKIWSNIVEKNTLSDYLINRNYLAPTNLISTYEALMISCIYCGAFISGLWCMVMQ
jgi:hypothetical protein